MKPSDSIIILVKYIICHVGLGNFLKEEKKNLSRTSRHYKGTRKLRKDIIEVHIPCILFKFHEKTLFPLITATIMATLG